MTEAHVPLVCLAAGYHFLRTWNATRYRWDALKWEHNLFEAAVVGGILFAITRVAVIAIRELLPGYEFAQPVGKAVDIVRDSLPIPFVGTLAAVAALAIAVPLALNRLPRFKPELGVRNAVSQHCGELLSLLQNAAQHSAPVMLTMDNRKVYVGLVQAPPAPKYPYTRILPTVSGFRDDGTMRVTFSTQYAPVYQEIEDSVKDRDEAAELIGRFCIVLPVDRICSANLFDNTTYERHFGPRS